MRKLRRLDFLTVLPLLALLGFSIRLIATQPRLIWVDVLFDDAYYYLGVARSLVETGVSGFLPPWSTNGYQPLWLLLLSGSGWLFGTGETALAIQMLALTTLFSLLFCAASWKNVGLLWPAVFITLRYPSIMLSGLETVMLPFLVLCLFRARNWKLQGLLSSAIFLTRLDALALVLARDLYALAMRRGPNWKHWLITAPVAMIYFLINYRIFGTPVPVSGLAKSVGNHFGENLTVCSEFLRTSWQLLLALALLVGIRKWRGAAALLQNQEEISCTLFAMLASVAYYSLMSGWPVWGWYYWPKMVLHYFLILELTSLAWPMLQKGATRPWPLLAAVAGLVWLLFSNPGFTGIIRSNLALAHEANHVAPLADSFGRDNIRLIDRLRQEGLPKGTLFAMGDRAGSFGYFLGLDYRLVQTEGLVGSLDYYRALQQDRAKAFLDQLPIDYLVADREHYLEDPQVIGIPEPIQGLSSHTGPFLICFNRSDLLQDELRSAATRRRILVLYRNQVDCPAAIQTQFAALRNSYGALAELSVTTDQSRRLSYRYVMPWIRRWQH